MGVQRWVDVLTVGVTDGPTLTAAAAASCIPTPNKITLPNNFFEVGKVLRITMAGRISSVITTPGTARFDVRIGNVVAFDSQAILLDTVAGHTNMPWKLQIELTCRAVGAGTVTQLFGIGTWQCEDILGTPAASPKGALVAMLPWNAAPALGTGFDNTISAALDCFFHTNSRHRDRCTVHSYVVEAIG
jgi:hypothetical protein